MNKLLNNNYELELILENINNLPNAGSSENGIDTTDATAVSSDILSGKTAYVDGEKITGTIPTKSESDLTVNGATIIVPKGYYASTATKSASKVPRADTVISVTADDTNDKFTITASNNQETGYVIGANQTATKIISLTANGATVIASDGTNSVSKSVATTTQATPSITVSDAGLITATSIQGEGYVNADTKTKTEQLTVQAAKTITPTASNQTAVAKGVYTTGVVTVKGDANLTASNIKSGTSIFGVEGSYEGEGLDTSDATAVATDILSGKTAYAKGKKITGNIATKTASDLTVSGSVVTVPSGYYSAAASKSVTGVTQATPVITVNASGLITATATQSTGYVASGTKSATKQLAFQPAKTITPSTTDQVAVSSGYYTGGNVTVKGDSNLVAANIKQGTSIFGVTGTYEGSGGGSGEAAEWSENEDAMVTGTLSVYSNDRVKSIGSSAFYYYNRLTSVNFPVCTTIGYRAFNYCNRLTSVNFPVCTTIGGDAFRDCSSLTSVNFPVCTTIGNYAFYGCRSLTSVSFPACTSIGTWVFNGCSSLTSVSFPACTTISGNAFSNCSSLTSVNFPVCTTIGRGAFYGCRRLTSAEFGYNISNSSIKAYIYSSAFSNCSKLITLNLYWPSVAALSNVNAFTSTPMSISTLTGTWGSIYVPASLVNAYKSATNWAKYADRITALTE